MLQYKIPQNVGIEDKIVGPFSLRQLIILAIGIGISYVLFAITSRIYELSFIEYFVIAIPAVFSILVAMVKIHNVTFGKYVLLTLEFAIKPKKRMWDHRGIANLVDPDLTDKNQAAQKAQATATDEEEKKKVNLSDLSHVLDSGGFDHVEKVKHEDIDEANDDDLITEAYFGHKREQSQTDNMYWRTKDMQKKKLDILAKQTTAPAPETAPAPAKAATAVAEAPAPAPVAQTPAPTVPETPPTAPVVPSQAPQVEEKEEEKKESVVENLANVIKEAKKNGEAKKKRARNRKPKVAKPARQNTQINTTDKNNPNLIQKPPKNEGTSMDDLKKGGEIEFNLD